MPAEPDRRLGGQDEFTVVRRGYRPAQVDQALAELRADVDTLVADGAGPIGCLAVAALRQAGPPTSPPATWG